jgi:hypothetical protein
MGIDATHMKKQGVRVEANHDMFERRHGRDGRDTGVSPVPAVPY